MRRLATVVALLALLAGCGPQSPARFAPPPSVPAPTATPSRAASLAEVFDDEGATFGVDPLRRDRAEIDRIGAALGCRPVMTEFFIDVSQGFDAAKLNAIVGVPVATVEPKGWTLAETASGAHDAEYRKLAATFAQFRGLIIVRFAHEMNGDWYPWGTRNADNSPARYVAAWRHVQQIFRTAGASNVAWLWSPNLNRGARPFAAYYPGDDWVDLVGMTGYGTPGEATAQVTFGRSLREMRALTRKRIVLTELSVEPWSGRTRWITSLGPFLRDNRDVAGVVWVERNGPAEGARYDWRFDRSPQDTAALAGALKVGGARCGP